MNAKDRIKAHWNAASVHYREHYLAAEDEEIALMKNIFSPFLTENKPLRVLDVGTGLGIQAVIFAEMGNSVTALDISEAMLRRAEANAAVRGLNITFVQGDAENLPFSAGSFDIIVTQHVLWTLTDHRKFFSECRRVLAPSGRIFAIDGHWFTTAPDAQHCPADVVSALPLCSSNTPEKIQELVCAGGFTQTEWRYLPEYADYMQAHDRESCEKNSNAVPYMITAVNA